MSTTSGQTGRKTQSMHACSATEVRLGQMGIIKLKAYLYTVMFATWLTTKIGPLLEPIMAWCDFYGSDGRRAAKSQPTMKSPFCSSFSHSETSRLQVTSALSAVQGLCNHRRQKPLPPVCKCQTWLHSHMDSWRRGWGGVLPVSFALPHLLPGQDMSSRESWSCILHTDQVVTGHLLLPTEHLATNIIAAALTHDGPGPSWFH